MQFNQNPKPLNNKVLTQLRTNQLAKSINSKYQKLHKPKRCNGSNYKSVKTQASSNIQEEKGKITHNP